MPDKKHKYDVFCSYSSGNREVVLRVADELKARGLDAWAYQRRDYNEITKAINEAMENSRDFVFFCSEHHLRSGMCDLELQASVAIKNDSKDERRIMFVHLDQEGKKKIEGVYRVFRSNDWLVGLGPEPPPSKISDLGDWIESQITEPGPGRGADPKALAVPVAVLAMTRAELAELEDGSQLTDKKAYEELKAFLAKEYHLTDLSVAYADARDEWRPFEWPLDKHGWPDDTAKTLQPASETIADKVRAAFEASEMAPWGDSLICSFWSERVFSRELDTQLEAQRELKAGPTGGCIFIVDVISLLHRELLEALKGAIGTLDARDYAIVLLSPLQLDAQQLHRRLYLGMKRARIDSFMNRYQSDLDPRAEIAGAGLHGMRRWLKRTFPEMFNHWFARGSRPDEQNLDAMRALPGLRKGPPPGQMQQDAGRRPS
jgi:TIR domain-containing protein